MTQAVNPYLPSYEYIPDGEPRVVDGRVVTEIVEMER